MRGTVVSGDGDVSCPHCGSTSFTTQRTPGQKLAFGVASLLAAPKLRCNGCGKFLDPKRNEPPPGSLPSIGYCEQNGHVLSLALGVCPSDGSRILTVTEHNARRGSK